MTDQERQIEHLKDQIFKLRITVQGISGTAAANAEWAKDAFQKEGFNDYGVDECWFFDGHD